MARTHVNNLERRKFVVARGDGMAGLSGMPEQPFRRKKGVYEKISVNKIPL